MPILPKKIRNKILKKILFNNYFKIITFATLLKKYHLYDVKALLNELLFGPQTIIDVNGLNLDKNNHFHNYLKKQIAINLKKYKISPTNFFEYNDALNIHEGFYWKWAIANFFKKKVCLLKKNNKVSQRV